MNHSVILTQTVFKVREVYRRLNFDMRWWREKESLRCSCKTFNIRQVDCMSLGWEDASWKNVVRHAHVESNFIIIKPEIDLFFLFCIIKEASILRLFNFYTLKEIKVFDAASNVHSIIMVVERGLLGVFISSSLSIVEGSCCGHLTILCDFIQRLIFAGIG